MSNQQSSHAQQTMIQPLAYSLFSNNFSGYTANSNSATNIAKGVNFSSSGGSSSGLGSGGGGGDNLPVTSVHNYRPMIAYTPPMIDRGINIHNRPWMGAVR